MNGYITIHRTEEGDMATQKKFLALTVLFFSIFCLSAISYASYPEIESDHNGVLGTGSCGWPCHTIDNTPEYDVYPLPMNQIDAMHAPSSGAGTSCATCHESARVSVIDTIATADITTAICRDCHTQRFPDPKYHQFNHDNITNSTYAADPVNGCTACHDTTDFVALHKNSCNTCHASPRQVVKDTINNGAFAPYPSLIDCVVCHNETEGSRHVPIDPPAQHDYLDTVPSCNSVGCHPVDISTNETFFADMEIIHDRTDDLPPGTDPCATCHTSELPQVISAISNGISGSNVADCNTCHGP